MKKFLLIFFFFFISHFAFSQADSVKTKVYRNDTLAARLQTSSDTISLDHANYFLKSTFTHKERGKKKKPYYWNVFLRSSASSTAIPKTIKQVKLYIITDSLIYEYAYLPRSFCWSKTTNVYAKPVTVVMEFVDTKTDKKYFVKSKGPFTQPKKKFNLRRLL